ncbi:MAG: hypothetical protein HY910_11330 [Desulfarculus sp.]|nr:hypothetical protein [Desulfarculus sp.]
MPFALECTQNEALPKLAWLARVDRREQVARVVHGAALEKGDGWLVEGVWDGPFGQGDFHQSENFFGSGIRLVGEEVHFVPSTASIDRLLYCEHQGQALVSNSLILMLAATGATLDDDHDYWRECLSIIKGVDRHDRRFAVRHPTLEHLEQVFYENIIISREPTRHELRIRRHRIDSFEDYVGSLQQILGGILRNMADPARRFALRGYSTLSCGYDSAAVAVIMRGLGVNEAFTGHPVRQPLEPLLPRGWKEDARGIGRHLGLTVHWLDDRRQGISQDELYYLCTNYPKHHSGHWSELSFHSMAQHIAQSGRLGVVFTGNHGDTVWDVNTPERHLAEHIRRGCLTGLNQTEIRLHAGYITVPVPFIWAHEVLKIRQVTLSPEMAPWRLGNGYDRPIPRRLLEEAGVPRQLFGFEKKFICARAMWPVNPSLRRRFLRHLRRRHGLPFWMVYLEYLKHLALTKAALKRFWGIELARKENLFLKPEVDLFYHMVHWATAQMAGRAAARLGLEYPARAGR